MLKERKKIFLSGAVETIKSQKPMLFISIYHSVEDFFEIKPWIENLDLGYKFEIIKEQPWTFYCRYYFKMQNR